MSQYTPCHSARGTVDLELKLSRTSIELVGEIGLSLSSGRPGSVRTYGSQPQSDGCTKNHATFLHTNRMPLSPVHPARWPPHQAMARYCYPIKGCASAFITSRSTAKRNANLPDSTDSLQRHHLSTSNPSSILLHHESTRLQINWLCEARRAAQAPNLSTHRRNCQAHQVNHLRNRSPYQQRRCCDLCNRHNSWARGSWNR